MALFSVFYLSFQRGLKSLHCVPGCQVTQRCIEYTCFYCILSICGEIVIVCEQIFFSSICSMAEYSPEKLRWCSNKLACHGCVQMNRCTGVNCKACFEESLGLNTHQIRIYLYLCVYWVWIIICNGK